jgi:hypothetical protein
VGSAAVGVDGAWPAETGHGIAWAGARSLNLGALVRPLDIISGRDMMKAPKTYSGRSSVMGHFNFKSYLSNPSAVKVAGTRKGPAGL